MCSASPDKRAGFFPLEKQIPLDEIRGLNLSVFLAVGCLANPGKREYCGSVDRIAERAGSSNRSHVAAALRWLHEHGDVDYRPAANQHELTVVKVMRYWGGRRPAVSDSVTAHDTAEGPSEHERTTRHTTQHTTQHEPAISGNAPPILSETSLERDEEKVLEGRQALQGEAHLLIGKYGPELTDRALGQANEQARKSQQAVTPKLLRFYAEALAEEQGIGIEQARASEGRTRTA